MRSPEAVMTALHGLRHKGLAVSDGAGWSWAVASVDVSESFQRCQVTLAIDTLAAGTDGRIGRHAPCFVRCDQPVWLLDLPFEGKAMLAGASLLGARQGTETLLTAL